MPNVHELIRDHVTLSIRCLDRLYLHAYLPNRRDDVGEKLRLGSTPSVITRV